MTDVDSDIVEDMKNTPLADETDDSCVLQLIEIVPLDRTSHVDYKPEFIYPVAEVKTEDLQDVKQEPADDYNTEDPCFTVQVRSTSTCNMQYYVLQTYDMFICTVLLLKYQVLNVTLSDLVNTHRGRNV